MRLAFLLTAIALICNWSGFAAEDDLPFPPPITVDALQPAGPDLVLAGAGIRTVIIVGEIPPYEYPFWGGHKILGRYLEAITGEPVVIRRPDDPNLADYDCRIWFGDQPRVQQIIGDDLKNLDPDGFVIAARDGDLYMSGKTWRAGHYAPYDLLERAAGCRWFMMSPRFWMPQEDGVVGLGDIIPRLERITVPGNTLIVEQPSYRNRWFRNAPQHSFRLSNRDAFHHNLVTIFPPATLYVTHPEFFPLIGGVRYRPPANRQFDFQPCISNPAVTARVVAAAREAFARGAPSFSLGMNDSTNFCQCEACQALVPASIEDPRAREAFAFFQWYNQIAAALWDDFPDRRLGCLAYASLSSLPEGALELHPMIVPYLTRDSAQLFDPREVAEFRETVDKWSVLATRMGVYEYIYGQGFYIPRLYDRYLLQNIKDRYGIGCDSFYAEAYPQWALDAPKYYFVSKLLWNHRYSIEGLKRDYYDKMFGPAAMQMRRYFDFLENAWCSQTLESTRSNYRWYYDARQLEIFPPSTCDQALAMLDEARRVAREAGAVDPQARIAFFRSGMEFTRRLSDRHQAALELEQLAKRDGDLDVPQAVALLNRWCAAGPAEALFAARDAIGLDTTSPVSFRTFQLSFDTNGGPYLVLNRLVRQALAALGPLRECPDAAMVDRWLGAAGAPAGSGREWLARVLQQDSVLVFRELQTAPTIDGHIAEQEWPKPAWRGDFLLPYSDSTRSDYETVVYAAKDAAWQYLAFDCAAVPVAMGARLEGEILDSTMPPAIRFDDCISISIYKKGQPFLRWYVNLNGATQSLPPGSRVKAQRMDDRWQVEIAIPIASSPLGDWDLDQYVNIGRALRLAPPVEPEGNPQIEQSVLFPVGQIGGTIGHGNHPQYMAYIHGMISTFAPQKSAKDPVP